MNMEAKDRDAQEFADVLAGLGRLAGSIDRRRYPGRAWVQRPRRRFDSRRLLLWSAGAAAAAALVLLAVYPPVWLAGEGGGDDSAGRQARRAKRPAAPERAPAGAGDKTAADWPASAGMDPSALGSLQFDLQRLPIPSIDKAAGFDWQIPSLSFPGFDRRSTDDDTQQDPGTGSSSSGAGGGGPVNTGPAKRLPLIS